MNVKPEQAARLLLARLRKDMNGAALDTMCYYGRDYHRNYGCQIYAIRAMAREVGTNHSLAEYLYAQDVRELKILALWIADPMLVTQQGVEWWLEGIYNSELAEQASHALLSRLTDVEECLLRYAEAENSLVVYALLLAVARRSAVDATRATTAVCHAVAYHADNALVARAAANLIGVLPLSDEELATLLHSLPDNATSRSVCEELSWRANTSIL